jgi:hypothetical protein
VIKTDNRRGVWGPRVPRRGGSVEVRINKLRVAREAQRERTHVIPNIGPIRRPIVARVGLGGGRADSLYRRRHVIHVSRDTFGRASLSPLPSLVSGLRRARARASHLAAFNRASLT